MTDSVVRDVRDRTDIVALIGEVVPLRRSGGANYKGRCPFHEERTPSFNVNPARQMYKCFGCGVGGDAFDFVMRFEGIEFGEALRKLADRVGVELPSRTDSVRARSEEERARARRDRLLEVNGIAADFFRRVLETVEGVPARALVEAREIGKTVSDEFRLGYAPDSWDSLTRHLASRHVSPTEAEELGLIVPRRGGSGHYDRFRNRLMFPVSDVSGHVIAFSGRTLSDDPDTPKYVNSSESAVYRKGRTLYGIGAARVAMRRTGQAILVEGNFDLLQLRQHGFDNVVAPMGTAFTAEQAEVLRRYAKEVVLLFDGDAAGRKAARAAWDLLAAARLEARIVVLPEGEDPDGFVRERGADALRALVASAPGLLEHLIDSAARAVGPRIQERTATIRELVAAIGKVADPLERDLYGKRLGRAFGLDDRQVRTFVTGGGPERAGSAPTPKEAAFPPAEVELVGALLDEPSLVQEAEEAGATEFIEHPALRAVYDLVVSGTDAPTLVEQAPESIRGWLAGRLVEPKYLGREDASRALRDTFRGLGLRRARREKHALDVRIKEAEQAGDLEGAARLLLEKQEIARRTSSG